jgi:hypothetical protein
VTFIRLAISEAKPAEGGSLLAIAVIIERDQGLNDCSWNPFSWLFHERKAVRDLRSRDTLMIESYCSSSFSISFSTAVGFSNAHVKISSNVLRRLHSAFFDADQVLRTPGQSHLNAAGIIRAAD